MSKQFYIGQRVRLVNLTRPENLQYNGVETHVSGVMAFVAGPVAIGYGTPELPLRETEKCAEYGGKKFRVWRAIWEHQLEPILPSGHRSGDYSYTELMDRLKAGEVECV